jgi:transcription-repair coupling factor (superfamily II helicase)
MSATPIPRTMHRAFAGFRDTSQITTPPPQRRAIQTLVAESNDLLVQEVIQRELDRDGQVRRRVRERFGSHGRRKGPCLETS